MTDLPEVNLVLASTSPRRRELLARLGVPFSVADPGVDEAVIGAGTLEAAKLTRHLAHEKAGAARRRFPDCMILAADTVVSIGAKNLGKPAGAKDALRMLLLLNGKRHTVTTAVVITYHSKSYSAVSATRVWFHRHDPAFLQWYVSTGEPMDKAGAYGIQGIGSLLVRKIEGDYFNVVGLPLLPVWKLLVRAEPLLKRRFEARRPVAGAPRRAVSQT